MRWPNIQRVVAVMFAGLLLGVIAVALGTGHFIESIPVIIGIAAIALMAYYIGRT